MNLSYKQVLDLVNYYIYNNFAIESLVISSFEKEYIRNNTKLSKVEKKYLRNKLIAFHENTIISISNGNQNIFRYRKYIIDYEHIDRLIHFARKCKDEKVKLKIVKNVYHHMYKNKRLEEYKNRIYFIIDELDLTYWYNYIKLYQ